MHVVSRPTIDPRRPIGGLPAVQEPRLAEQRRAAYQMLEQLKTETRLAGIMLNPIFAPHANTIAMRATARAFVRYETEVPRKDFETLLNEEQAKARKEILGLPQKYYAATAEAAEATGTAIVTGAKATGNAIATGAAALLGGLVAVGTGLLRGLGSVFSFLGKGYQGLGSTLTRWGQA